MVLFVCFVCFVFSILSLSQKWEIYKKSNKNIRVFTSRILKILAFSILKNHFITFNISLYNTLNIKHFFFFLQLHLNIISLLFFCFYFFHPLSLLVSLSLSLSQPNNPTHRRPPTTTIPTTTTMIWDPCQSSWQSTPVKSMIHKPRPMNPNPQTHTQKIKSPCRTTTIGREKREVREKREERSESWWEYKKILFLTI